MVTLSVCWLNINKELACQQMSQTPKRWLC